ncbi:MAG: hypothetical protein JXB34_06855 [Bacteroidales bacterium]|nr:hypothetical protein [Bacteroidales bacterium]
MAKYLVFIPPHLGHINPTLGIGAELLSRGNSVTWAGISETNPQFFPQGGRFYVPEEFQQYSKDIAAIISRQDECTQNTANKMIKWAFESTWLPIYEIMIKGIRQLIRRENPDIIIHDEGLKAAAIGAYLEKVPYVTSITNMPGLHLPGTALLPDDDIWLGEIMNGILLKNGIPGGTEVFNSPFLNLVYTSKSFADGNRFPGNYSFVGPILEGRQANKSIAPGFFDSIKKPVVYVSTGSLLKEIKEAFYAKAIEAFKDMPVTFLVSVSPDLFDSWPENFIPKTFWPQLQVLPWVDAVVSAGGFNTINESLYFGKPMLVIPLANDQFGNGMLIENKGCGLRLRYRRLTPNLLGTSLNELLNNPVFKAAAQNQSKHLKMAGGVPRAVELIEDIFQSENIYTWQK